MRLCTRCKVPHSLPNVPDHLPESVPFACRRSLGIEDAPGKTADLSDVGGAGMTVDAARHGMVPADPDARKRK